MGGGIGFLLMVGIGGFGVGVVGVVGVVAAEGHS
jgi:hypothetical protein